MPTAAATEIDGSITCGSMTGEGDGEERNDDKGEVKQVSGGDAEKTDVAGRVQ